MIGRVFQPWGTIDVKKQDGKEGIIDTPAVGITDFLDLLAAWGPCP